MRMTIAVTDNLVIVDGVGHKVDCSSLRGIHAVQWIENQGIIEYAHPHDHDPTRFKGPSHIDNTTMFKQEIDAWQATEAKAKPAREMAAKALKQREAQTESFRQAAADSELVKHLREDTPAELERYVRSFLDSGGDPKDFAKRMEDFAVQLAQVLGVQR